MYNKRLNRFHSLACGLIWFACAGSLFAAQIRYHFPLPGDRSALEQTAPQTVLVDEMNSLQYALLPEQQSDQDYDGVADIDDNCANTPPQYSVDLCGCPLPKCWGSDCEAQRWLRYYEVKFRFDEDQITAASKPRLRESAREMIRDRSAQMDIGSHADNLGSDGYNLALTEERAEAIKKYLRRQGVSGSRLRYQAYGESEPLVANKTEQQQQENRRGEMLIGWWQAKQPGQACDLGGRSCEPLTANAQIKALSQTQLIIRLQPPYFQAGAIALLQKLQRQMQADPELRLLILAAKREASAVEVAKRLLSQKLEPWRLHIAVNPEAGPVSGHGSAAIESLSLSLFKERR